MSEEAAASIDVSLYPDIAEAGGVGPAWQKAARQAGIELDEISWGNDFFKLTNAVVVTSRGTIELHTVADKRAFSMLILVADRERAWGTTNDLVQAARVAAAWGAGSSTRDVLAAFPFMRTSRIAQAEEDGNLHEVLWNIYLENPGYASIRPVLQAAYDDPRLRRLYPSVSHETLARFTVDPRDRTAGQVGITRLNDHYEITSTWHSDVFSARTVTEATAIAAAQVPDA